MLVPFYLVGAPAEPHDLLGAGCVLFTAAPPLVGLGISAWVWRRDAAASAVLTATAAVAVAVGYAGWWIAADPKGINLIGSGLLVPPGQAIVWCVGLVLARAKSSNPGEAEPVAAPDPARVQPSGDS